MYERDTTFFRCNAMWLKGWSPMAPGIPRCCSEGYVHRLPPRNLDECMVRGARSWQTWMTAWSHDGVCSDWFAVPSCAQRFVIGLVKYDGAILYLLSPSCSRAEAPEWDARLGFSHLHRNIPLHSDLQCWDEVLSGLSGYIVGPRWKSLINFLRVC